LAAPDVKLVTYLSAGRERLGALSPDGEAIVDLHGVSPSAIALLEGGEAAYELEFGIFIGRQGVDIPKERAREHIAGYTGNSIGPWLVTADEIADPYDLTMIARVNGEDWSRGTSADMHYSFEELIAYISRSETLYPGDFIGSGTCSGSQGKGCGLELGRFLSSGDTVELEVEGIGILRNTVS
jgi:2-keto-4-pentenoate hydratase/2-oxohepta-3-ene-1,7-dioic acid hydratase in catechol pathway